MKQYGIGDSALSKVKVRDNAMRDVSHSFVWVPAKKNRPFAIFIETEELLRLAYNSCDEDVSRIQQCKVIAVANQEGRYSFFMSVRDFMAGWCERQVEIELPSLVSDSEKHLRLESVRLIWDHQEGKDLCQVDADLRKGNIEAVSRAIKKFYDMPSESK
jgi:hypothetical protein